MDTNIGSIAHPPKTAGVSEEAPGVTYLLGKHYFQVGVSPFLNVALYRNKLILRTGTICRGTFSYEFNSF